MNAALLALQLLKWLQTALAAGQDISPILAQGNTYLDAMVAGDRGPLPEEQAWIDGLRHQYEAAIHQAAQTAP